MPALAEEPIPTTEPLLMDSPMLADEPIISTGSPTLAISPLPTQPDTVLNPPLMEPLHPLVDSATEWHGIGTSSHAAPLQANMTETDPATLLKGSETEELEDGGFDSGSSVRVQKKVVGKQRLAA